MLPQTGAKCSRVNTLKYYSFYLGIIFLATCYLSTVLSVGTDKGDFIFYTVYLSPFIALGFASF